MTERKLEPPLFLDMGFEEALARFAKTDPREIDESVDRSKKKKPPGDKTTRRRPKKDGPVG